MSETPNGDPPAGETPTPPAGETPTAEQQALAELPDDHPLVKTLATLKATAKTQGDELKTLRPKARRLDELEEAAKSDAEKTAEKIAKAEAELASIPAQVAAGLRAHLIALHEIDAEDAELFLTATDPELLLKQAARLAGQDGKPRKKNHVPREGTNPRPNESTEAAFVRELFGSTG
jgi:hypothetical protein